MSRSAEPDTAFGRRDAANDQLEQGALAGAVRADQAVHPAFVDAEVKVVDRRDAAKAFGEAAGFQQLSHDLYPRTAQPPEHPRMA